MKRFSVLALALVSSSAFAQLTETFPDPLGGWRTRWLGVNTDMRNYYVVNGNPDENNRGNNPAGLWMAQGSSTTGPLVDITFDSTFGATLSSLSFGVEAFVKQTITIYDMNNTALGSIVAENGDFGFGHEDVISVVSANGISKITFDSTPWGNGQIEGNTSVDNFRADVVPEPGTMIALGAGVAALARRRRRA